LFCVSVITTVQNENTTNADPVKTPIKIGIKAGYNLGEL